MRTRTRAPMATLPLEPSRSRTTKLLAAVATATCVPLRATAVPLTTPARGAARSVIAISATAMLDCRMYSVAFWARFGTSFPRSGGPSTSQAGPEKGHGWAGTVVSRKIGRRSIFRLPVHCSQSAGHGDQGFGVRRPGVLDGPETIIEGQICLAANRQGGDPNAPGSSGAVTVRSG